MAGRASSLTLARVLSLLAALGAFGPLALSAQDPAATAIRALLTSARIPSSRHPDFTGQVEVLSRLYAARGDAPLWDDGNGLTPLAHAAIVTLGASAERGLDPEEYDVRLLDSLADAGVAASVEIRAERDVLLSRALSRYLSDLRDGRVPDTPFDHLKLGIPIDASVALVQRAAAGEAIETLAREVEPPLVQYRNLLRHLARYHQLAGSLILVPLPRAIPGIGEPYAGAAELRRRLIAYGDLIADSAPADTAVYDSVLAEGVRHFQFRHSLEPDGVLGAPTRRELAVPPARREEQIALALERLRWLPPLPDQRIIVVNIPAFTLVAFDSIGGTGTPVLQMRVVIGRAFDKRTPVMYEPLRSVEFRPYWNIPVKILREEYLPQLSLQPLFLRRQRMEVLGARDSVLGDGVTPEILWGLANGAYRLRQRPGGWNALGATKFTFPNRADIYLHGTPDTTAFSLARRDLSHGCIRLQDPGSLAEWALRGVPGWDIAQIDSVVAGTGNVLVPVAEPIGVLIYYATATATSDGEIRFHPDIYGHDRRLRAALTGRSRGR
ncbi:MAG: L,D-transpeptidase family protein [Gemmatimonadales bacterium]